MTIDWNSFDNFVSAFMNENHVPGLAVAVAKNGEVIYQNGFGFRNLKTEQPVTPETIFGTASVTKSFTAAAIVDLEKQGKLSIQDSVSQYLPELRLPDGMDPQSIKIHHLLSHTTGLPPIERREDFSRLEDHIEYLAQLDIEPLGQPGEVFSYSNDSFLLLGLIIERVTGKLYRRYITEHFLNPLGMTRSTFSLEELTKFNNVTEPYLLYDHDADHYKLAVWPKLGNYEVGGGIRSTVLDLLKYGQLFLGQTRDAYAKMWSPVIKVLPQHYYGYALEIIPNYEGMTLVKHSGGQPGVSSHFGFIPEKDIVIAVLSNLSDVPASDVWLAAANAMLGLPIDKQVDIGAFKDLQEAEAKPFIGTYTSEEGERIQIKWENKQLYIAWNNECHKLSKLQDTVLGIASENFPVPFYCNNDGEPWGLFFGMRVLKKQ